MRNFEITSNSQKIFSVFEVLAAGMQPNDSLVAQAAYFKNMSHFSFLHPIPCLVGYIYIRQFTFNFALSKCI